MNHSDRVIQLVATFLPLYGVILTILAGIVLRKGWRIAALLLIPLLTLGLCSYFGEQIAYDGNLLYVSLAMIYFVALCFYYPVLLIVGCVSVVRKRQSSGE